jgi:hypothetical protein
MELLKAVCRPVSMVGLWGACPELLGAQVTVFAAASFGPPGHRPEELASPSVDRAALESVP